MSLSRGLVIALCFFLDVRVRAADRPAKHADCWGKTVPCAIFAAEKKREFKDQDFTFVMAMNSLAERQDESSVRLVDGRFYIEISKPFNFKTPYAIFSCLDSCKALVDRRSDEVQFKAIEGQWKFTRNGEKRDYQIAGGLQISVGEVETTGVARMEFPQGLPWQQTVLEWSKFYAGSVDDFKRDVRRFRADWKRAVENVSDVHLQVAQRVLASHEADLAKERARRKAELKEEAQLRELFRQKTIDP